MGFTMGAPPPNPQAEGFPSAGAPEVPATLGAYRIVRPLGRGGMGVVYRAEHLETGEAVALKTVDVTDASMLSGIRREIHALRRLDHPGVVRIVAEGVEAGLPWYAMELLEGSTLAEYNASLAGTGQVLTIGDVLGGSATTLSLADVLGGEPAPRSAPTPLARPTFTHAAGGALPRTLTMMAAICDALAFVHGVGLIHRDLKPSNVFLRDGGAPVLADFGLALQLSGGRGRDVVSLGEGRAGSPPYMAPEQIEGELMDARVDLYALGCMLYESVTGTPPFVGSLHAVLRQHLNTLPERPGARVPGVPPALDDLILELLQKQPRDRLGYADDVAAALARLGAEPRAASPRARPYLYRSTLAGRTAALAQLEQDLRRVRPSRGGRTFVGGESGVGKTRFATEAAEVARRHGLRVVTGECAAVSATGATAGATADATAGATLGTVRAAPLHPFKQLLLVIADHCRHEGPAETEYVFGDRGPVLAAYEPAIGRLPGVVQRSELPVLAAPAARARLHHCLAGALAAFAEIQPVLLILDDLQWADESSLAFLQSLDEGYFAKTGMLLLGTYRTEDTSADLASLLDAPGATRIDLGRLDAGAVERMVSDMLAMPAPPAPFLAFLVAQSEGNPFFIAEYLRVAVGERLLHRDAAGVWQLALREEAGRSPYDALPLSGGLRDLVTRRVAGLGDGARALARMAAVLGREFDGGVLAAATSLDDLENLEAVDELRRRQILDVGEGARLRFTHDKLREVIYGDIAGGERRRLHAAAGAALVARHAGTPELAGMYPLLVHHFTIAGADDETFEYLEKAGQRALDTGASTEALGFFRRALALDDARRASGRAPLGPLRRAELEARLGHAAFNLSRIPEAERFTRAALHRLRGSRWRAPEKTSRLGALATVASQLAVQMLHLLGPERRALADPAERRRLTEAALAAERLTQIHFFQNDRARAFGAALQMANLAGGLGSSPELARSYAMLSIGFLVFPVPGLSAAYAARAQEAARAASDPQTTASVSRSAGVTAFVAGRWAEGRTAFGHALALSRDAHDHWYAETSLGALALIELMTSRPEGASTLYEELDAAAARSGNTQHRLWAMNGQALCRIALGRAEEALAIHEQLVALAKGHPEDRADLIRYGAVAPLHLLRGDPARARRVAEDTLAHMVDLSPTSFHLIQGYVATAEVFLALWEQATTPADRRALAHHARRSCQAMRSFARLFRIGRPHAHRFEGLAEALEGRPAHAQRAFARSLAAAIELAMPVEQGLAHYEMGRHLHAGAPGRAAHLAEARAIFERLGRHAWLERAERVAART
jgi:eukaryotic-like serine/threonine-protein kinase